MIQKTSASSIHVIIIFNLPCHSKHLHLIYLLLYLKSNLLINFLIHSCRYVFMSFLLKIKNATCFICQKFDNKRYIDNQKVQEADEIKQDICKYLVSSDVEDDA